MMTFIFMLFAVVLVFIAASSCILLFLYSFALCKSLLRRLFYGRRLSKESMARLESSFWYQFLQKGLDSHTQKEAEVNDTYLEESVDELIISLKDSTDNAKRRGAIIRLVVFHRRGVLSVESIEKVELELIAILRSQKRFGRGFEDDTPMVLAAWGLGELGSSKALSSLRGYLWSMGIAPNGVVVARVAVGKLLERSSEEASGNLSIANIEGDLTLSSIDDSVE